MNATRGQLIAERRKALGKSQQEVADAAHITQQALALIEADQIRNPKRSALRAIGKMLDIPFETLILDQDAGWMLSEDEIRIAREYSLLNNEEKIKIMHILIEARAMREEKTDRRGEPTDC